MTTCTSQKLLNTAEAAERLGIKKNTLEIWRLQGKGPVYRKIGKLVRYVENDVATFIDAAARTSTSHQGLQAY